jgi:regulator of replication initiation timing
VCFQRLIRSSASFAGLVMVSLCASGQAPPSSAEQSLADSVAELRAQVQELRAAVSEMKSEATQYRQESAELRKELETLRSTSPNAAASVSATGEPGQRPSEQNGDLAKRLAALEETTQLTQSELRTEYQTKIESASKYRVRFSGLALFNLFENRGTVDNLDFPTYAAPGTPYGKQSAFGATLRQSQFGMEVFGPELAGARTRAEVQFDFGGGFPTAALDGINLGLVRLRTASMHLDWDRTSVVVGQDNLFLSPGSPTSFASLAIPSLGYSGNLWAWTPQVRIEHTFDLADDQNLIFQAGILDNLTGEPSYASRRQPQSGENSGYPAYAIRTGWSKTVNGKPLIIGVSGYYSRQNWGFDWDVDGWAAATDWKVPVASKWELSGEFYRGRAVGGLGGAIGQSVLFSGNPFSPTTDFRAVNSAGGWSQLKFAATSRLEFNGAVGIDTPFAKDTRAFIAPVGYYPTVLTANRSAMANFIFRPRSDLLFSAEYRRLRTSEIGAFYTADQVNMMMGVLF